MCIHVENLWLQQIAANPGHSQWYIERFRTMARNGADLGGEARLIDAMVARGARILDAGCGAGRVGGLLAGLGHDVTGVDLDPELIAAAEQDYPGPDWRVGDLAVLDLPDRFDVIVCASNVMTFVAPDTRGEILRRMRAHLGEQGHRLDVASRSLGSQPPGMAAPRAPALLPTLTLALLTGAGGCGSAQTPAGATAATR